MNVRDIIVGSTAARNRLPSFKRVNDLDIWTVCYSGEKLKNVEFSVMSVEIMEAFEEESKADGIATLNDLMTIKMSHLPWDIQWHKNMNDYLVFKKYGAKVNQPLYELLKDHWKLQHGNKSYLSLYRKKDEFFDDYVPKEYDHDYLHELVAYPEKPVYNTIWDWFNNRGKSVHDFVDDGYKTTIGGIEIEVVMTSKSQMGITQHDEGKDHFSVLKIGGVRYVQLNYTYYWCGVDFERDRIAEEVIASQRVITVYETLTTKEGKMK